MWSRVSHIIIKYRLFLLIFLGIITVFMAHNARQVKWSYDLANVVPKDDPEMVGFQEFKKLFGEDANIIAIGVLDSAIYDVENFRKLGYLSDEISTLKGVKNVLALPSIQRLVKDTKNKKFNLESIFAEIPENQHSFDSLLELATQQKFYDGQLINHDNGAMLLLISIEKEVLNSSKRVGLTEDVLMLGDIFSKDTGIELHYAGLPFVRSVVMGRVKKEMLMFIGFSVFITGLIMLIFFRSWTAVIFPMVIIAVVVLWVLGTLSLLGFKITMLTGVIPSIIVVIGIPNSIYLLNKYHAEYGEHGNKTEAISRVVQKIGLVTLITNTTTAVGFIVLAFTDIQILKEFGIVAGVNIMATFVVSIILLPSVFSYLPEPTIRHLKHLEFKPLDKLLTAFDLLVHRRRYPIFIVTGVLVVFAVIGLYRINAISFMVDDIPEDSVIKKDLAFFEDNFGGIMPLEIIVDTKKPKGVMNLKNLETIEAFETFLDDQDLMSKPVSIVSFIKASRQAFYNNNPSRYELPNKRDKNFILRYFQNQSEDRTLLNSFVDSTAQKMRISLQIADIGSKRLDSLINDVLVPKKDEIFKGTSLEATITGTTPIFIKGNKFLIENLQFSFLMAFGIIALIMAVLFVNVRMIILSIIPNVIPLVITAGLMGYLGIPLKPSTAIVFSIAFGISVDYAIHFLARYRQELFANDFFVPVAVSKALKGIGPSMIYTSIVLFAGFIIFTVSDFGGTVALGFLTSITLFISMLTNLIVLPALLLTFDDGKRKADAHPLIEQYDEFYNEEEDEEINLEKIEVENVTPISQQ
jgi:predicted RND superfamily exporter protein